jgi:hypothetical protein
MKLLETWQIREALEYAGTPQDEQSTERLNRALNYFNLPARASLVCRWRTHRLRPQYARNRSNIGRRSQSVREA